MKNPLKVLALIPARGGSKSILRKNLYPILGKPLIAYSIEAAKATPSITRVIVSTDDDEIAEVARTYGAETPFMRPAEFAEDNTPDLPVFQHALKWLKENENYEPDLVLHLWPTSPLRNPDDLDQAVRFLSENKEFDSLRSMTTPSQTPFKMWHSIDGIFSPLLENVYPELYGKGKPQPHASPRQILPPVYVQTGYVAIMRPQKTFFKNSMFGEKVTPFFHDEKLYTEFDSLKDAHYTEQTIKKYIDEQK